MPRPVLALCALLLGCVPTEGPRASAPVVAKPATASLKKAPDRPFKTPDDGLVFAIGGDPETLDPAKARGVNEGKLIDNLFEGLLEHPLGGQVPVPGVAARWSISDDGLTYIFHLRRDARWSNGDPVTAEDFRYSWLRVLDPTFGAPYADMLFVIEGARAYYMGRNADQATVGVKAVGPHTLEVRLAYVAPYFLELCSFQTFRPVHRATVERHGGRWTRPENIVSNGAYILAEWAPGQRLEGRRNPHYWDQAAVALEMFRVLVVQENTTLVNLYEAGELDWTGGSDLPAIKMSTLSRRPDYHQDPYNGVYFYRFNVDHPALADARVRRALSFAVDRAAIARVMQGGVTGTGDFVPPSAGYPPSGQSHAFEPEVAQHLLAQAGYPRGKGFPRMRLLYNTQENHKRIAEMIQQMWRRYLGVRVDLENREWKVYLANVKTRQYQVTRSGWIGDYHDPMTFLDLWTTGNGNNNTGWSDREYDALIERARRAGDPRVRFRLLSRAEKTLLTRGPVLPIYHYARSYLLNPAVRGFVPHRLDRHPIKYMRKVRPSPGTSPESAEAR